MTEAMPFLQKYDITFLRPLPIAAGGFLMIRYRRNQLIRRQPDP